MKLVILALAIVSPFALSHDLATTVTTSHAPSHSQAAHLAPATHLDFAHDASATAPAPALDIAHLAQATHLKATLFDMVANFVPTAQQTALTAVGTSVFFAGGILTFHSSHPLA